MVLLGPAGVAGRQLWRAFRIPLGFCFTGALPLLFAVGGPAGLVSWAPDGPRHAAELLLRTSAPPRGAAVRLHHPGVGRPAPARAGRGAAPVVDVALVMYRIGFLLLDSMAQVRRAQAARLGHTGRAAVWRSLAGLAATSFVRAFDRAARLQEGLAGRGYDGALRVLVPQATLSWRFLAASGALLAALITVTLTLKGLYL